MVLERKTSNREVEHLFGIVTFRAKVVNFVMSRVGVVEEPLNIFHGVPVY